MRKIFLIGLLVLILIVAGCRGGTTGSFVGQGSYADGSGKLENGVRVVNVKAFQFNFDPNPIIVNKGERVKLIVTSTDVAHGIVIPDYNINVPAPAGKPTTIEFIADKEGNFPFFCNVY